MSDNIISSSRHLRALALLRVSCALKYVYKCTLTDSQTLIHEDKILSLRFRSLGLRRRCCCLDQPVAASRWSARKTHLLRERMFVVVDERNGLELKASALECAQSTLKVSLSLSFVC